MRIEFLESRIALAVDVSAAVTVDVLAEAGIETAEVEIRVTNESEETALGVDIEVITSFESAVWRRTDELQSPIIWDPLADDFLGDFGTAFPSTTGVGDLNGDGAPDIGNRFAESIKVYLGSTTSEPSASQEIDVLLTPEVPWLEAKLRPAGDFNGDGVDDLMIIARETPGEGTGRIYVVYGGSSFHSGAQIDLGMLDGSNGFVTASDRGLLVGGGAGDFNGDGTDDLAIGAADLIEDFAEFYVVFGGNDVASNGELDLLALDVGTGFVLDSFDTDVGPFGAAAGVGDTNGDGLDDVALIGIEAGESLILYGGQEGFLSVDAINSENGYFIFLSDDPTPRYANGVSSVGDMNGDGLADFVLSHVSGLRPTDVLVIFGSSETPEFLDVADEEQQHRILTVGGVVPEAQGEVGIAGVGNFNGDSYDDIVVGAPGFNRDSGAVYVIFGGPDLPREMNVLDLGVDEGLTVIAGKDLMREWFYGVRVFSLDDVNNDGLNDIGVSSASGGRSPFVLYGRRNNGRGDFVDSISQLGQGEVATYVVTGQVAPGGFTIAVQAFADDQEDSNLANNQVNQTNAKLAGDVNLDGEVSFADFLVIAENFGRSASSRLDGDLNDDALVSFEDFLILANDFGRMIDDLA